MHKSITIGIDFDNTLVCYDELIYSLAQERIALPSTVLHHKEAIRDYLRETKQEDTWVEIQGLIYGKNITQAVPFPGAQEMIKSLLKEGHTVAIVSHKSKVPHQGPAYDLHGAAHLWLEENEFFSTVALPRSQVYLEETKELKLKRIGNLNCDYFIDDLPELLQEPDFPSGTKKILFCPHGTPHNLHKSLSPINHWSMLKELIQ